METFSNLVEYNECEPAICEDGISVYLVRYDKIVCQSRNIYIGWKIQNEYGNTYFPTTNNVIWSINNQLLNNTSASVSNDIPYYTIINALNTGILFFKLKININGKTYESSTKQIIIKECENNVLAQTGYVIPTKVCDCDMTVTWSSTP